MTPTEEGQLATLFERVNNLIHTLNEYIQEDRKRHDDNERALTSHIATTLPIINEHFAMRGEFAIVKAALWLIALSLGAVIGGLVVNYITR